MHRSAYTIITAVTAACFWLASALQAQSSLYPTNPFSFRIDTGSPEFSETFFTVDVNNDGWVDFTFRTPDKLYVYDHLGNKLWEKPVALPNGTTGAKHCAGDFDGDGQVEIAALDTENRVIVYNARTGGIERTYQYTLADSTSILSHISAANLRGQGDRDAILQTTDITPEHSGYEYYVNRTVFAINLENGTEIWPQRVEQNRDLGTDPAVADSIYEGYWGQAHGPFLAVDIDGDGKDEVVGGNMIDDNGDIISLSYPQEWVQARKVPTDKSAEFIDHLDAVAAGNLRPDIPGIEWIVVEEDHNGNTNEWNTTLISSGHTAPIVWRHETTSFNNNSDREPQNIAIGNFDTTRSFGEIWLRSRLGDDYRSQQPWMFDTEGSQIATYETGVVLPPGFHSISNNYGLEMIWTIDWFGTKKEYSAAQSRHVHGNIGVFDAKTGRAVWTTGDTFTSVRSLFTYVADITGDTREEVVICDSTDTGLWIRIYRNTEANLHQAKPAKWDDPLYTRLKQNWNYYSPGGYTTPDYPVISGVSVTDIQSNGFMITWTTDIPSDSRIEYGQSSSYASSTGTDTAMTTVHSVQVTGLNPDTEYHYRIISTSAFGISGISTDRTATTDFLKQLTFLSTPQSLYAGTVSAEITIQLQNIYGEPRVLGNPVTVLLSTSSSTGSFSADPYTWQHISEIVMPAEMNIVSFYYRDNTPGTPVISLLENPSRGWVRKTQQELILSNGSRHLSHRVYGSVETKDGQPPENGTLHFTAYIPSQSSDRLTENSTACGYADGIWWVDCALFSAGWAAGEHMVASFIDSASGGKDTLDIILISDNPQQAAMAILGIDPPWITGLQKTGDTRIMISWNDMPGIMGYNIYRSTTLPFTPDVVNGTNRIAVMVTDENPAVSGVQWTDTSAPLSDPDQHAFYIITAVNASEESRESRIIGKIDYALHVTPGTDLNMIGLPLQSLSPNIQYASDLRQQVPGCSSVSEWQTANQGYRQYIPTIPSSNFAVSSPHAYGVNVTENGTFTLLGEYRETAFSLVTTTGTDFNFITLPLSRSDISSAASLVNSITGANSLACWDNAQQTYVQYVPELPFSNFAVVPGYPYMVNVTTPSVWPTQSVQKEIAAAAPHVIGNTATGGGPHLVWGRVALQGSAAAPDFRFAARLRSGSGNELTERSPGCGISGGYWMVQCGTFPGGWQAGDTLIVDLVPEGGSPSMSTAVILSTEPADRADDVLFSAPHHHGLFFGLENNYPNPFNAGTALAWSLTEETHATLAVYNILGRKIRVLADGNMAAGRHTMVWDGRDAKGAAIGSGIYIIVLDAGGKTAKRKVTVTR
ncbi:VCBS repeat-containing protein [bacterium]|nr:VCBS repeat-containing protein [bacterium]